MSRTIAWHDGSVGTGVTQPRDQGLKPALALPNSFTLDEFNLSLHLLIYEMG